MAETMKQTTPSFHSFHFFHYLHSFRSFQLLNLLLAPWAIVLALFFSGTSLGEETIARGVVYHDVNRNAMWDEGDEPLEGIRVSNGRQVVKTDAGGRYELPVDDDTILFVIKPRGWRTPIGRDMLPKFYYIHKPAGSPDFQFPGVEPTGPLPESVDFPLYPQDEPDQFQAILFGDPQPRDQREVDYMTHDVVEELVGTKASFGVTLGDIVFDDLSVFQAKINSVALIGIPWYNVVGNHDINYDAKNNRQSTETFQRYFGPPYYSFDHGPTHFLVLDDIMWTVPEDGGRGSYKGGLGPEQMEFIRNDLALVPDSQMVVLMMHIPLVDVEDRQELFRMIEKRPFCMSISAHRHVHEHRFLTKEDGWEGPEPHHHLINVTVSGSWWSGAPDTRGIPHTMMADGGPNGYTIISFDGTDYTIDYKVARRPESYQMNIESPEEVAREKLAETEIFINVFNGSPKSTVEMRVGEEGEWRRLERRVMIDPAYQRVFDAEAAIPDPPWRSLPRPRPSTHLWRGTLPSDLPVGSHLIQVRTEDMHGRTFEDRRAIRVVE
jgi:hypothetical protein